MAEQEELRLVVTLDDQASAQLGNLRAQLSSMAAGINQTLGGAGAAAGHATKGVAGLHTSLNSLASRAGFIGGVISGITKQITEMGTEVVKRATDLDAMAASMMELSHAAHSMGTSTAQLKSNLAGFREAGVPLEAAKNMLAGIADTMARINTLNDPMQARLMTGNFLSMERMRGVIAELSATEDLNKQADILRKTSQEIYRIQKERTGSAQWAAARQADFEALVRAQGIHKVHKDMLATTQEQIKLQEMRDKSAAEFTTQSARAATSWDRIGEAAASTLMLTSSGGLKLWADISAKIEASFDKINARYLEMDARAKAAEAAAGGKSPDAFRNLMLSNPNQPGAGNPGLPWWLGGNLLNPPTGGPRRSGAPAGGGAQHFMGGGIPGLGTYSPVTGGLAGGGIMANSPESQNVEDRRSQDDNTRTTEDNTVELKRLNELIIFNQQPGIMGGKGLADQLGIGDIGGGGGGATRYPGGGSGPGIGSGGATTDAGGAATHAGGAGGGAGVSPGISAGTAAGSATYQKMLAAFKGSSLIGKVPPGGERFGITTGSAEEWARFGTAVAKAESSFNPRSANTSDPGGSFGILQYAHNQVPGGNAYDVDKSIEAFVRDAEKGGGKYSPGVGPGSLLAARFSTIGSHPDRTIRNLANYNSDGQPAPGTAGGGTVGAGVAGDTGYVGTGRFNFMGSAEARAMGINVAPGSAEASQQFSTGITSGAGPRSIRANKFAGPDIAGFLKDLSDAGAPLKDFAGAYVNKPRQHGMGNAVDIETGFGSGPDNSRALWTWAQAHPKEFADIQARHHMRNLTKEASGVNDWGHFEWSPQRRATPEELARRGQGGGAGAAGAGVQGVPVTVVSFAPDATHALVTATTGEQQRRWPSQALREQEQVANRAAALTERERLEKRIHDYEHGSDRETPRHRGVGGEAAPIGGAPRPGGEVPTPRGDPRYPPGGRVEPLSGRRRGPVGLPGTEKEYREMYKKAREAQNEADKDAVKKLQADEDIKKQDEFDRQARENLRERDRVIDRSIEDEDQTTKQNADDAERAAQTAQDRGNALRGTGGYTKPTRDPISGFSSKAGSALDASGRGLDAASNVKVTADGTLRVDVNAAKGTSVAAAGSGAFKKTVVNRQTQMEPAGSGPNHDPDLDS